MRKKIILSFPMLLTFCFLIYAQDNILVKIERIYPEELNIAGFELDKEQEIEIEATGLFIRDRRDRIILGNTWILNSDTREVVWSLEPVGSHRRRIKVQKEHKKIKINRGSYEVYYASYPYIDRNYHWHDGHWNNSRGVVSRLFEWIFDRTYDWDDYRYDRHLYRQFGVVVKGQGQKLEEDAILTKQKSVQDKYPIFLEGYGDNLYLTQGFTVKEPLKLNVTVIGEARDDGNFDYGWILNLKNHKRIWSFDYDDSDHAGGADKNRIMKNEILLPKGRYVAAYVTDDSHSPQEWNSAPPYDPNFWGMAIQVSKPEMLSSIDKFDYIAFKDRNRLLSLAPMRDNHFDSEGFTLNKPLQLRVYAIGEGRSGEMFDYGWIVNATTHERVWEMDFDETIHAGGSQKNRLFDEVMKLDKGNYIAYYVTDGSHSYRDWNASPPFDPDHWGLTIYAEDENFSPSDVDKYEEEDDPLILAKITRVRVDQYKREGFSLKKDCKVRIYALGEGTRGEMFDYGWIEDEESGKVVWEMRYRETERAGGARKNRLFNDTILLKKGKYKVYYESDDSHSFNEWNDTPPHDPINWGITLYLVEDK